jgi:hypothetical protein
MIESTRSGAALYRRKKSRAASTSARTLPNSPQCVTSRRECRHSISIGFSHGLYVGR